MKTLEYFIGRATRKAKNGWIYSVRLIGGGGGAYESSRKAGSVQAAMAALPGIIADIKAWYNDVYKPAAKEASQQTRRDIAENERKGREAAARNRGGGSGSSSPHGRPGQTVTTEGYLAGQASQQAHNRVTGKTVVVPRRLTTWEERTPPGSRPATEPADTPGKDPSTIVALPDIYEDPTVEDPTQNTYNSETGQRDALVAAAQAIGEGGDGSGGGEGSSIDPLDKAKLEDLGRDWKNTDAFYAEQLGYQRQAFDLNRKLGYIDYLTVQDETLSPLYNLRGGTSGAFRATRRGQNIYRMERDAANVGLDAYIDTNRRDRLNNYFDTVAQARTILSNMAGAGLNEALSLYNATGLPEEEDFRNTVYGN